MLKKYPNLSSFISGSLLSAAFAPVFFWPAIFTLTFLAYKTKYAYSWQEATKHGYLFGFGFFTFGIYWMAIGVSVYIDEFWWAIPFALFGLPSILAIFISIGAGISWYFRNKTFYILFFSFIWAFLEWIRSWIFTGLPWNLLGYTIAFSDELIQLLSITGIYGVSFLVIYIATCAVDILDYHKRNTYFVFVTVVIAGALTYGSWRLQKYPTVFNDIKIRIVQPNIQQTDKWDIDTFWENMDNHVQLSNINSGFEPNIIVWSEAAVTVPHTIPSIKNKLQSAILFDNTLLITGGISEQKINGENKIYSAMYAMNKNGSILFEYHKAHLVPFGEYIPLRSILSLKKLSPGIEDYTEGERGRIVKLNNLDLTIKPLICYEAIFPAESRNIDADIIINITNDTWYGNSSGPYQHYHMSRMRAVENGIPLVRAANSGISGIIDPLGRIISQTKLGHKTVLDGFLPTKIPHKPLYVEYGNLIAIVIVALTHLLHKILYKALIKK